MTRGADIDRVRTQGKRIRGKFLEIRLAREATGEPRIGIIVPRHHRTAVERNTIKRRLREVIRMVRVTDPLRGDAVVIAGPRAYGAEPANLRDDARRIWHEAATSQEAK